MRLHRLACIPGVLLACDAPPPPADPKPAPPPAVAPTAAVPVPAPVTPAPYVPKDTCSGTWPSYWQDPAFDSQGMWKDQPVMNTAAAQKFTGPTFRLSDAFPGAPVDDRAAQPWRDAEFDALFAPTTPQAERTRLGEAYIWAVMRYLQAGNIDSGDVATDWDLCTNKVRPWFHMPYQTYDSLTGREFIHGLTREAPVTFSLKNVQNPKGGDTLATTVWAVGFYNATAAATLGEVWRADATVTVPTTHVAFAEGATVGKLLFTTATAEQFPNLRNVPTWTANISDPAFCACKVPTGKCSLAEQAKQCPRAPGTVALMQFDVAVKDARATTGWVLGTFVADGEHKASEPNPWNRIAPLGLMWGNDPPPAGALALQHPPSPRERGFAEEVVFWDVVDRLNAAGGTTLAQQPGHLGCNGRLNGPADNATASCTSCHMTASVPDAARATPPMISWFNKGVTSQCADPATNTNAAGIKTAVQNGIGYPEIDGLYFSNVACEAPFPDEIDGKALVAGTPKYADGRADWLSTDFSFQLSIALVQWLEWQQDRNADAAALAKNTKARLPRRVFDAPLPLRGF